MELLLLLSIVLILVNRMWPHPLLPVLGCAAAIGYGVWRGGVGGAVFGGLAVLLNLAFWLVPLWLERHSSATSSATGPS